MKRHNDPLSFGSVPLAPDRPSSAIPNLESSTLAAARLSGKSPNDTAPDVGGLFFPQFKSLGIDRSGHSLAQQAKIVYAGANNTSYERGDTDLKNLADMTKVGAKQVSRICKHIGDERCIERDDAVAIEAEAWDAAFGAVMDAITRCQKLRAGPPDPPKPPEPPRCTPRRPLRERGRTTLTRVVRRFRMAARVLILGHRPATVGYDALDRRIAMLCAFWKADIIAGRYATPLPTMEEDDDICWKIAWLVYEAIEAYITYSAESEALSRKQLAADEELRRQSEAGWPNGIPF